MRSTIPAIFRLRLARPRPGSWPLRRCAFWAVASLWLIPAWYALNIFLLGNHGEVVPGKVYRSAQQSGSDLERLVRRRGIRTVVNLRGCCPWMDWYKAECEVGEALGLSQEDISLSANRFPPVAELRRLVDMLDRCEYPVVLHCRQGADRTGLACAMILLLYTDATLDRARDECAIRYGHFRVLATARMDEFFDVYEDRLRECGEVHSPARFRRWVLEEYVPGPARADMSIVDAPEIHPIDRPLALTLDVVNRSHVEWQFRPGTLAGIHARFLLTHESGELVYTGRAGQMEASVSPGESIRLTLALPKLRRPGHYTMQTEMIADQQIAFSQLGCDPITIAFEVR